MTAARRLFGRNIEEKGDINRKRTNEQRRRHLTAGDGGNGRQHNGGSAAGERRGAKLAIERT